MWDALRHPPQPTGAAEVSGFLAGAVGFVAVLIGATCLGTFGVAILLEVMSRRK